MVTCSTCGSDNPSGHSFCSTCGSALAVTCSKCGTSNDAAHGFCFNCGNPLGKEAPSSDEDAQADAGERRLVSVVFADLVGYTSLSEGRDPEDVRSMLTNYYDRCREIIARYGGVTDKFIGDAVMGVWGASAAHEDDAERATRAALELVDMVDGLGDELGIEGLAARAGVLSGEASVGSGGNDHGLVVGDLVNTASRLQSIAPPGGVYAGLATRDLVGSAIEFTEVGDHIVKGKEIPVSVFHAVRVLALSTARRRGDLAEGPFVGRDDELRMLKDQLHATGREGRARLVSVIGEGGIGKTRLSEELLRYIDGITEDIYYHSGRSPAYGDGVTYWALGEMIRQRAGILETEDAAKARLKLRTMVADFAPDEEDQRWIEPRLAAVIGLGQMPPGDRSEIFAAMRTFFQRIADRGTVLMVFEDLHWADEGLLDFIEELVERTTRHPILVLALGRPDLLERRGDWGASRRRSLLMHLSRLDRASMNALIAGLAPGLPEDVVDRITSRTAGVPLHAVEFVRMLVNSEDLVVEGGEYRFRGDLDDLAVPDSVNAMIGARLDRLEPSEVSLIQDASVLGLTFSLGGIADLRNSSIEDIEPILGALVHRDILELDEDPRSPERGQYRFVQSLIREVAYSRLPKSDRAERHLEIARRSEALEDVELAGVIAGHYASAAAADPANLELAVRARDSIVRAAERARDLRSDSQAVVLYDQAIAMTDDSAEAASLKIEAATCLEASGSKDEASKIAKAAYEEFVALGVQSGIQQAATCVINIEAGNFNATEAAEFALPVFESATRAEDPAWVHLAAATAKALSLADRPDQAIEVADDALRVAHALDMGPEIRDLLTTKGTSLAYGGLYHEGSALLRGVGVMAAERGDLRTETRALNNYLAVSQGDSANQLERERLEELVERSGNQAWYIRSLYFGATERIDFGQLEDAGAWVQEGMSLTLDDFWRDSFEAIDLSLGMYTTGRSPEGLSRCLALMDRYMDSTDPQLTSSLLDQIASWHLEFGDPSASIEVALSQDAPHNQYPYRVADGLRAAALVPDLDGALSLVNILEVARLPGRLNTGLLSMGRMTVAGLSGDTDEALRKYEEGLEIWSEVAAPRAIAGLNATAAVVLGGDHPVGSDAARAAQEFYSDSGFVSALELYSDVLPTTTSTSVAI